MHDFFGESSALAESAARSRASCGSASKADRFSLSGLISSVGNDHADM